jgi:hypothetical protein
LNNLPIKLVLIFVRTVVDKAGAPLPLPREHILAMNMERLVFYAVG